MSFSVNHIDLAVFVNTETDEWRWNAVPATGGTVNVGMGQSTVTNQCTDKKLLKQGWLEMYKLLKVAGVEETRVGCLKATL
jgi:hypothetical protein